MKQLILPRIVFPSKILEFTSKEPNAGSPVKKDTAQIAHVADICVQTDLCSILRLILLCLEFEKFFSFSSIRLKTDLVFFLDLCIRIQIHGSCITIHDRGHTIPLVIRCNVYQSWDLHCLCHNGGMRNG